MKMMVLLPSCLQQTDQMKVLHLEQAGINERMVENAQPSLNRGAQIADFYFLVLFY
jgi:hypothetical protein